MFNRYLLVALTTLSLTGFAHAGSKTATTTNTETLSARNISSAGEADVAAIEAAAIAAAGDCCADFRSGGQGGCWRKCGGMWKDKFSSEAYCRDTNPDAKCRAEYRTGGSGGCWMKCRGFFTDSWKNQVDESFCQIRKCSSSWSTPTEPTPPPSSGGGSIGTPTNPSCCVDFRSGGGCWRKCGGMWKDLMSDESICRDSDPRENCHAEYRSGGQGGCWRKCGGNWKDKFPTELPCQVRRCQ